MNNIRNPRIAKAINQLQFAPYSQGPFDGQFKAVFWDLTAEERIEFNLTKPEYNHFGVINTKQNIIEGIYTSVPPDHKSIKKFNPGIVDSEKKLNGTAGQQTFVPFGERREITKSALDYLKQIVNDHFTRKHEALINKILNDVPDRKTKPIEAPERLNKHKNNDINNNNAENNVIKPKKIIKSKNNDFNDINDLD